VSRPLLEIHVPISPRPFFFNRVRYLAKSLRTLGRDFEGSKIIVSVGHEDAEFDLDAVCPWARDEGIEWRWVDRQLFLRWYGDAFRYVGTMMARYKEPFESEFVMMADADIILVRDFSTLLAQLQGRCAVAGVMAHMSPFRQLPALSHAAWWCQMFSAYDLPDPRLEYEHTGWGSMFTDPSARYSPAYFNSGMLLGTREAMNRLAVHAIPATEAVRSVQNIGACDQVAFTLMMYKAQIEIDSIPIRYNFPNIPGFEDRYPDEFNNLSILHYLRHEIVHRDRVFASEAGIEEFVARSNLAGTNEVLRACISALRSSPRRAQP
jgi:hypothetical protein